MNILKYILKLFNKINISIIKNILYSKKRYKIRWYRYDYDKLGMIDAFFINQQKIIKDIDYSIVLIIYLYFNIIFNILLYIIYYSILFYSLILLKINEYSIIEYNIIVCNGNSNEFINELSNFNIGNEIEIDNKDDKIFKMLKFRIEYLIINELIIYIDSFTYNNEILNSYAKNSLLIKNAGGRSEISEMFSIHILMNILNSYDCIYEKKVEYKFTCKLVDYILFSENEGDLFRVGVSTTRAFSHFNNVFTYDDGYKLLMKKITGLVISRQSIDEKHNFFTSILHIFAQNDTIKNILLDVIKDLNIETLYIKGVLNIWITVSAYEPIYSNTRN